ncbi:helix-turn-helix transcriptional regulator [Pseudoxanthomonas beigongshangi]|uniref:helix-turn-helix transcriptional regulator n=1 Tax=Pseudoxanthomonas beigongshangi TaxID=2782537 RepID=UPI003CCD9041
MEKPAPSLTLENVLSVARRLGVCRSTIHAWVQTGRFPAPIKVGRSSRWLTSEVNDWVTLQARTRKSSCTTLFGS